MASAAQTQTRIETVQKLDLHDGDIVHVKVGGEIQVNGMAQTWVPSQDDLVETFVAWTNALAEMDDTGTRVGLIVTHHLIEPSVLGSKLNVSRWPPTVLP